LAKSPPSRSGRVRRTLSTLFLPPLSELSLR